VPIWAHTEVLCVYNSYFQLIFFSLIMFFSHNKLVRIIFWLVFFNEANGAECMSSAANVSFSQHMEHHRTAGIVRGIYRSASKNFASHHSGKSAAEVLYLANSCNSHMTVSEDGREDEAILSHNLVLGVGASSCSATKNMRGWHSVAQVRDAQTQVQSNLRHNCARATQETRQSELFCILSCSSRNNIEFTTQIAKMLNIRCSGSIWGKFSRVFTCFDTQTSLDWPITVTQTYPIT